MIVTLLLFCYISVYEIFVFIFGNMKKGFLLEWTTFIYNKCHISEHTISGLCFHWLCCRFPLLRFRIPYLIYSCALKGHCLFTISILIEMHCSKIEPTQMKGREGKGEEKCSTSFKLSKYLYINVFVFITLSVVMLNIPTIITCIAFQYMEIPHSLERISE